MRVACVLLIGALGCGRPDRSLSAKAFVQRFYDAYVPAVSKGDFSAVTAHPAWFDSSLRAALETDRAAASAVPSEIVGLDFDPYLDTQDPCDRYVVGAAHPTDSGYLVDVAGVCQYRHDTIQAEVVPRDTSWMFVDFHYPHRSRLRTVLATLARDRVTSAVREIAKAARYATLATVGLDGQPQSRIVDPLVDSTETIWIATNPLSRKVDEMKRDPRVTLTFFNPAGNEYVTVLGRARPISDTVTARSHWKADWAPFYKDRYRGADFLLIAVKPFRIEASSPARGVINDARTWKPVIVELP